LLERDIETWNMWFRKEWIKKNSSIVSDFMTIYLFSAQLFVYSLNAESSAK